MTALDESERTRHGELIQAILSSPGRSIEIETGYRREFDDDAILATLAEWIALEHRCCPFLLFSLGVSPKTLAVELSGRPGVKDFLKTEFGF